jgi:hypothetical protein
MHPSFGIEYTCPSTKWEDIMKGPSRTAVMAHTYKILHYRSLSEAGGLSGSQDISIPSPEERPVATEQSARYAEAA